MENCEKNINCEGEESKRIGNRKKTCIISAFCLLLVALLVVGAIIFNNAASKQYVIYLRENNLMCAESTGKGTFVVTAYGADASGNIPFDSADCVISHDDSRLFFPQKYSEDGLCFTLSYIELDGKDFSPKKIAFNISDYAVNNSGNIIMYVDKKGNLYEHNLQENVRELITVGASDIIAATEDLNSCFYSAKGELYVKNKDEEALKLTGNRGGFIVRIYSSGEVYYIKNEATEHGISNNLYFFDGEREFLVDKDVLELSIGYSTAVDTPGIVYRNKDKMTCVCIKADKCENAESISGMEAYFSGDGKALLVCDKTKRYTARIKGNRIGEMKPAADGINAGSAFFITGGKLVYSLGTDLYIGNKMIATDVIMEEHFKCPAYYEKNNALLYFEEAGGLYIYNTKNGETTKVSDSIAEYVFVDNNRLIYRDDEGGLIARNKGKPNRLDTNVSKIVAVSGANEAFVGTVDKYTIFK